MQTLTLSFSENDVDVLNIIHRLRQLKKTFHIEPVEPSTLDDSRIVWEFPEPDEDWEKSGLSALLRDDDDDWECPEEWIELSKQNAV